jgi:Ser/Thr protein kinase RdoA (MazF antagonist)
MTPTPDQIERLYGFSVHRIEALGESGRAWRLDTAEGPLVLRIHGPGRIPAHAAEMAVLRRLSDHGYPAARVVPTRSGEVLFPWEDGEGYVTRWIEGVEPEGNLDDVRGLGRATGRLHAVPIVDRGIPDTRFDVPHARREFLALDTDPAVRAWAGYGELRDAIHATWAGLAELDDVPRAIVHTDVHFGNAVRTPTGGVVLVDWDDAGVGPAIQDVGCFLVHHAVLPAGGGDLAPDVAAAFLGGYQKARALVGIERRRLPDAMIFGALSYVLAPWAGKVLERNWRRVRVVLDRAEDVGSMLDAALRRG